MCRRRQGKPYVNAGQYARSREDGTGQPAVLSGRHVWQAQALPKIRAYYEQILGDFSVNDVTHMLHYLLKMLDNMKRVDQAWVGADEDDRAASHA